MAYLGNPLLFALSSTVKDVFNGDGSTTSFTLQKVSRTNDLEVFVENVQQQPTVAYTVSQNVLTFTEAPPVGTGNIYAVHRTAPVQTLRDIDSNSVRASSITNRELANDSVSFTQITLTSANGIVRGVGVGGLYLAGNNVYITNEDETETALRYRNNGSIQLYHNNTLKFETTDSGATVFGNVTATAFYGDGSNLSGVDALPTQTGNSGKYLTTDGSDASWDSVQSGAILDVFWTNGQNLSTSYTIPANRSAITAGPITLDSDVEVTLDSNAVWVIL